MKDFTETLWREGDQVKDLRFTVNGHEYCVGQARFSIRRLEPKEMTLYNQDTGELLLLKPKDRPSFRPTAGTLNRASGGVSYA